MVSAVRGFWVWFIQGIAVAPNKNNSIFVTGYTAGALEGTNAGIFDIYLAKYASRGEQLWIKQFGSTSYDYSKCITIDSSGSYLYAAGYTKGNLVGTLSGTSDIWFGKFNSSTGASIWIKQFGTTGEDLSTSISLDSNDNIYIGGYTTGSLASSSSNEGSYDIWLGKFNSTGVQDWIVQTGVST